MAATHTNTRPLGMVLVQQGVITTEELELALAEQLAVGGLLGEVLIRRGLASRPHITAALAAQFGLELESQSGFGSGLRSQIQHEHDARRERARTPLATDGSEEALSDVLDAREAPAANGDLDADEALEPADGERIELLLTLVAERDAGIAQLSRELEEARALAAELRNEGMQRSELTSAVDTLEDQLAAERAAAGGRSDEVAALRAELEDVRAALDAARSESSEREAVLDALLAATDSEPAGPTDVDETARLELEMRELRASRDALASALDDRAREADALRRAAAEADAELTRMQVQLSVREQELADALAVDTTAELVRNLEHERERTDALVSEVSDKSAALLDLRRAADELAAALAEANAETARLRDELEARVGPEVVEALKRSLADARAEADERNRALLAAADQNGAHAQRLANELAARTGDVEQLRDAAEARETALAAAQHEAEQLQAQRARADVLERELTEKASALADAQALLSQREAEVAALDEVRRQLADREAEVAEGRARGEELEATLRDERGRLEALQAGATELEQSLAALRAELAEREWELGELATLRTALAEAEARAAALQDERETFLGSLEERSAELADLRRSLAEAQDARDGLAAEVEAVRAVARPAEDALGAARDQLAAREADVAELRGALAEERARADALETCVATATDELAAVRERGADLEAALASARTDLAEREGALAGLADLRAALTTEQARGAELAALLQAERGELEVVRRGADTRLVEALEREAALAAEAEELRLALDARGDELATVSASLADEQACAAKLGDEIERLTVAAAQHDEILRGARDELARVRTELAARPRAERLIELEAALEQAAAREHALAAECDRERSRSTDLGAARDRLTFELDSLRRTHADSDAATSAARGEIARLHAQLEARPTAETVAVLRAALDEARTSERRLADERDSIRARADGLGDELGVLRRTVAEAEQAHGAAAAEPSRLRNELDARPTDDALAELGRRADEHRQRAETLAGSLERAEGELSELRREEAEAREALAEARVAAARLEGELEARPPAGALAELRTALDGQRERVTALEEELVTTRARARARAAELEDALDRQRAKAGELAAALYDERADLEALREADGERTAALEAAGRELVDLRGQLDRRPTDEAVVQLREAVAEERAERERLADELAASRVRMGQLEARVTEHQERAERFRNALEGVRDGAGELLWSFGFDVRARPDEAAAGSPPDADARTERLRIAPSRDGASPG